MIKRICLYYGKEFETIPSQIKYGVGKYCSRECFCKNRRKRIKRICEICGKEFEATVSAIKYHGSKYCSYACTAKSREGKGNPQWKEKIDCVCSICGKNFKRNKSQIRKRNYCSRECANEAHKSRIKRKCLFCGKIFEVIPSDIKRGNGKYCSQSCARKGRKGFPKHHTKPELIFEEICKKNNLPFKYTGDGSFWIGKNPSINPDFVECNGKKTAVEIFSYWHDPLRRHCKVPYSQTYMGRKKILKKYGWKLVIFWQDDLMRNDAEAFVLNKLKLYI